MDFSLEPHHEEFLAEIREYLSHLERDLGFDLAATAEANDHSLTGEGRELIDKFIRQLGKDGWLGISCPKKFGGQDRSFLEQFLFLEELSSRSLPTGVLLIKSNIPALAKLAPEQIREKFLPQCLSGEVSMCIGYSEPDAGSDLANLKTRATPVEGGYRINGQKIWTTAANVSTHIWLATRTGTQESRHKGITMFIVAMDTPGITITPIITQAGERTNQVFFDNVFVPVENRITEENEGWNLIMGQLAFERMFYPSGMMRGLHSFIHWWSQNMPADVAEREYQLRELGRMAAEAEAIQLLALRTAWMIDQNKVPATEASILKLTLSATEQRNGLDQIRLAGAWGQLSHRDPDAPSFGRPVYDYLFTPATTFGAGANELQRDMIADFGLGLPRNR